MGKVNRKERKVQSNHHDNPRPKRSGIVRRSHSLVSKKPGASKLQAPNARGKAAGRPRLPFNQSDRVLCIGEGDFSFALSLATCHNVNQIVATCYDSEETLHQKYSQAKEIILQLLSANRADAKQPLHGEEDPEWNGLSPSPSNPGPGVPNTSTPAVVPTALPFRKSSPPKFSRSVYYAINATKLSSTHSKLLNTQSPFTKIVFNFPHVGGLSTDVNRQVRANQELLVGFFKSAIPLLASPRRPVLIRRPYGQDGDRDDSSMIVDEDSESQLDPEDDDKSATTKGQILVTLFEGEPYTLWNIRDLARHSGLKVVESSRFPWEAYPGYTHARTVGEITRGRDRSAEGKRKGAWRGEEREARCFVLEVKEGEANVGQGPVGREGNSIELGVRKRRRKSKRTTGGHDSESGSD